MREGRREIYGEENLLSMWNNIHEFKTFSALLQNRTREIYGANEMVMKIISQFRLDIVSLAHTHQRFVDTIVLWTRPELTLLSSVWLCVETAEKRRRHCLLLHFLPPLLLSRSNLQGGGRVKYTEKLIFLLVDTTIDSESTEIVSVDIFARCSELLCSCCRLSFNEKECSCKSNFSVLI